MLTAIALWLEKVATYRTKRLLENEAVRELSRLTDKELSDIGLHRGNIRAAVKNSL